MVIMQTCMEHANKLFEKFNRKINRTTQQDAWNQVISKLAESAVLVPDAAYLRKRVANWLQRATVIISYFYILHIIRK